MIIELISLLIAVYEQLGIDRQLALAHGIKRFEKNLRECHKAYLALAQHPKYSQYQSSYDKDSLSLTEQEQISKLAKTHKNAVTNLVRDIERYSPLIEIYSPEAGAHLFSYITSETAIHPKHYFSELIQTISDRNDNNNYETALEMLHKFIREHIDPADYH